MTPANVATEQLASLRSALLAWYGEHRRDLPWRRADDPYAVWVSEMMLQQTRVATVIPYYERWMARFPTLADLARAELDEVLGVWQGLGYYARARRLHGAARAVLARHGGELPADVDALLELPGVGPYTAGAIASIAFGLEAPLVDGNVARVLARAFAIDTDITRAAAQRQLHGLAAALVRGPAPGDFNQALMELGATVCTPASPRCLLCPWRDVCVARAEGRQAELPVKAKKVAPRLEQRHAWVLQRADDTVLVARRNTDGLLGGLWEFPISAPADDAERAWRAHAGDDAPASSELGVIEHVFTHMRWCVHVHVACANAAPRWRDDVYDELRWVSREALATLATPRWMSRAVAMLGASCR